MGNGSMRNKDCWCGSGKKFKNCHLGREQEKPLELWQAELAMKQSFGKKFCSCPDLMKNECEGKIINAHTVSKSSSLKTIARDGHVYGIDASVNQLSNNGGIYKPKLLGINKASTFTGFCSHHDSKLFSPFENEKFKYSKEQLFLIAYRTFAREFYTKESQLKLLKKQKEFDTGMSPLQQAFIQNTTNLQIQGATMALQDNLIHKNILDEMLISKNYSRLNAYVIEFEDILPIACSGGVNPEYDFHQNKIQNISDDSKELDIVCLSVFSEKDKSYAVFAWLDNSNKTASKLIASLEKIVELNLFNYLITYIFVSMENIYINPQWWESLDEHLHNNLIELLMIDMHAIFGIQKDDIDPKEDDYGVYSVSNISQIR